MPAESDHVPDRRPVLLGLPRCCHRARKLNLPGAMTPSSLRQLALESEPPRRGELSIALVTLYVVVFAVLACKAVDYLQGTNMETWAPSSQTDLRARFV
jgi:hypothetical protein